MHPKDIQRHVHATLRQADNTGDEYSTINRPKTCVVQSHELHQLNLLLKCEFPTIYELIGGVEGLLMCADKGDHRIMDICNDREKLHDSLTGECYNVLDSVAQTESFHYSNYMLPSELDKEFVSWGFTDTLLKLTNIYKQILTDDMSSVLQNEKNIMIINIVQSPIQGVYYIQFQKV